MGMEAGEVVKVSSSLADNQDLVIEILSQLPIKSLVRFMCVSQEWSALIKSSRFIAIHQKCLQRLNPPNLCLLYGHSSGSRFAKYPKHHGISLLGKDTHLEGLDLPERVQQDSYDRLILIAGSSNGLVCLYPLNTPKEIIVVWNPATRQHSKDRDADGRFTYLTQVFTRSEKSWREVKNCIPPGDYNFEPGSSISSNGVVYCLARTKGVPFVFSFNLHDEVIHNMPMPPRYSLFYGQRLFTWENSVAFLTHVERKYDLWVMEKESGTQMPTWNWTAQFTIKNLPQFMDLIFVFWDGLFLFVKRQVRAGQDLVTYDRATTGAMKAFKLATGNSCLQVVDYVQSLVSVF
ncbi:putative F-box protein At1g32420 isoform X1 [Rosa chinensis]|uniref:putative F-box protein At1g32420 isoform X1 n=1 Tax=Rosa chinensis TaxID=74649 RepID=UPI001AD949CA|nr:putative F-box protein At1g32420 isoform X1 [Rosa chinensis]